MRVPVCVCLCTHIEHISRASSIRLHVHNFTHFIIHLFFFDESASMEYFWLTEQVFRMKETKQNEDIERSHSSTQFGIGFFVVSNRRKRVNRDRGRNTKTKAKTKRKKRSQPFQPAKQVSLFGFSKKNCEKCNFENNCRSSC